jgi:hypothetical protein
VKFDEYSSNFEPIKSRFDSHIIRRIFDEWN